MLQGNQLTMEKKNMDIHKQKPNVNACEYCGTAFTKDQDTYGGIYCNIQCAAHRGVRYGYNNLVEKFDAIKVSDWNEKIFPMYQYEKNIGVQ